MAYTEFYAQFSGSNLNAGSTTDNNPVHMYESGSSWISASGIFIVAASKNPLADGVAAGDWGSLYPTGSLTSSFVGRILGVNATSVTMSLSARGGTPPTSGTSSVSLRVGGAWQGPTGSIGFPFLLCHGAMQNAAGDPPCFNFKNDAVYTITSSGMTYSTADNLTVTTFQGYSSSVRDGGRAIFDGGATGTGYVLLTVSGKNAIFADMEFRNNGSTGTSDGVSETGTEVMFYRCVFHDIRGNGVNLASGPATVLQCEAYNCNKSNTTSDAGFMLLSSGCDAIDCIAHHNSSSSGRASGFELDGGIHVIRCISAYNDIGMRSTADVLQSIVNCDIYGNRYHGIFFQAGATDPLCITVMNCNFVNNGAWGINFGGAYNNGVITNNGFGSGSQANGSGSISGSRGLIIQNSINYPVNTTPWVSPTTGDFRINSATAKKAGFGSYLQTYTSGSWTGSIGYSDIGAAQHLDTGERSYTFC